MFGWLEAVLAAGIILGAIFGPALLHHYKYHILLRISILFVALACFTVYILPYAYNLGGIAPLLVWTILTGIGESLIQVPTANIILTYVPDEIRGQGVALSNSL